MVIHPVLILTLVFLKWISNDKLIRKRHPEMGRNCAKWEAEMEAEMKATGGNSGQLLSERPHMMMNSSRTATVNKATLQMSS